VIDFTIRRITEDGPRLDRDECAELSRALAQLYVYNHQFEKAIRIYMTLRDQTGKQIFIEPKNSLVCTVFGVINRHKLFTMVKDKIVDLMNISADQAIRLLLDNEDLIPSPQVVSQLGRVPRLQVYTCFKP
jgi:hypothetical protein